MSRPMIFLSVTLFFAAAGGAQTQREAPQASPVRAANAWMKTPYDLSSHDDLAPDLRRLRDGYWDSAIGHFGVLTPQTVVHTSDGDYGPPAGEDPEFPNLRQNAAALIGTFKGSRTILTPSGRAIYTDITFSVEHVFQDAVRGHAASGPEITLSVEGGTGRTAGGQVISYMTDPKKYFMQPGGTYLLILYYFADGDFYVGTPAWDLSGGVVRANCNEAMVKATRGRPTIVGLTKDELIRSLDERFSGKR